MRVKISGQNVKVLESNYLVCIVEQFLKQRLNLDDRHVKLLEKKFRLFLQNLYNEPLESALVHIYSINLVINSIIVNFK